MRWLKSLHAWLFGGAVLKDWRVVLYTRRGCHLCDRSWERLCRARRRYGFTLTTVDVDTEEALRLRFGEIVPVVEVNGRVRFRGCVNPVLLERLLRAAATERGG